MGRKGFTLIELLVVVVIIGIVAGIGIPKYANSKSRGYVIAMKADLRNLLNAQEEFFADSARYSSNVGSLKFTQSRGVEPPSITVSAGAWSATISHSQLAGSECGIGVNTTNPVSTAGEGEPACK